MSNKTQGHYIGFLERLFITLRLRRNLSSQISVLRARPLNGNPFWMNYNRAARVQVWSAI
jgi:hypothetical protein